MKARIVQPECAELCRGCPNSCKQPAWMEVLRCPKIGYEHPDYEKIMAQARENDEIEHYIPEGKNRKSCGQQPKDQSNAVSPRTLL